MNAYLAPMLVGVIAGATASGKSDLALRLAERNGFALINADARQIYAGLEIGTAAPTAAERARVPHHLFGFLDAREAFSPKRYRDAALRVLEDAGTDFLVVGGSGLYLKELLAEPHADRGEASETVRLEAEQRIAREGLAAVHAWLCERDPQGLQGVHPADTYRVQKRLEHCLSEDTSYVQYRSAGRNTRFAEAHLIVLERPRAELLTRIEQRIETMLAAGWKEEVRDLVDRFGLDAPALSAVGYREIATTLNQTSAYLGGTPLKSPRAQDRALRETLLIRTRQYAKRQTTFFRSQIEGAQAWNVQNLETVLASVDWNWARFCALPPANAALEGFDAHLR